MRVCGQNPKAGAGARESIKAGMATLSRSIQAVHYPRDSARCVPTRAGQPERAKSYSTKPFERIT
jgi:hypothetical protein